MKLLDDHLIRHYYSTVLACLHLLYIRSSYVVIIFINFSSFNIKITLLKDQEAQTTRI